ncbi:MAG TPA: glycosyltransferase, partial [Anaerolineales bacterium]|nr:glycosyltransferase [Anaerolineales bacterium]
MPPVSILLPCYNAAATLPDALASLTAQTLTDFEVIAVDDGSTDATADLRQGPRQSEARRRLVEHLPGLDHEAVHLAEILLLPRGDAAEGRDLLALEFGQVRGVTGLAEGLAGNVVVDGVEAGDQ